MKLYSLLLFSSIMLCISAIEEEIMEKDTTYNAVFMHENKQNQSTGLFQSSDIMGRTTSDGCYNIWPPSEYVTLVKGCPATIPIILDGKILAGKIWYAKGNDLQGLACNGGCNNFFAETKKTQYSASGGLDPIGSIIVNPGCKMYIFQDYNYEGEYKEFTTGTYPNPQIGGIINGCANGVPCIHSSLWTCKQTYPSCTPLDGWEPVTELDNSGSSIPAQFSYEKTVGTTFSQEMKTSMGVSDTVSASISAEFWGITASMGVSSTTHFDWTKTDSETKSEATTYVVQVLVPPKIKVQIQEAVGTCGGSKIHTQMFRVLDSDTGKITHSFKGKMDKYDLTEDTEGTATQEPAVCPPTPTCPTILSKPSCPTTLSCKKKRGKCFGKGDTIPENATYKGTCNKKTGCKCYAV